MPPVASFSFTSFLVSFFMLLYLFIHSHRLGLFFNLLCIHYFIILLCISRSFFFVLNYSYGNGMKEISNCFFYSCFQFCIRMTTQASIFDSQYLPYLSCIFCFHMTENTHQRLQHYSRFFSCECKNCA